MDKMIKKNKFYSNKFKFRYKDSVIFSASVRTLPYYASNNDFLLLRWHDIYLSLQEYVYYAHIIVLSAYI